MLGRSLGGLAGRLRRSAGPLRQVHTSLRRCQQQQVSEGKPVVLSKLKDDFMDGTSSTYLEQLEQQYRADPSTVDRSWAAFFRSMDSGISPEALSESYDAFVKTGAKSALPIVAEGQSPQETMRLAMLVRAHQVEGHRAAQLDPLGLQQVTPPPTLDPAYYGFEERHMDREYSLATWNQSGFMAEDRPRRTLREILRRLRETYCGSVGFEYMHIDDHEKCNWIRERIELLEADAFSKEKKMLVLDRLTWSEMFESFLANKYTAAKRFGLEGCEALIPGMKAAIDRTADLGTETIVIGMPHRGRLNILANVMRKPMEQVFSEFAGRRPAGASADDYTGSGDVKYHLGTSYDRPTLSGRQIHLSLMANPSHLEAVNTVALGKVRAKQYYANDDARRRNLAILLHGDGAFAGQGIVYETLDMSALPDYTVGGTIHLVVNNQVAFTTDPKKSRSSPYCTDVAKALSAPIFHVNSDDPEAVVRVCELAAEWRQTWGTDVVIDLVGYRKYGHNEIDEPMFTQPLMYKKIRAMRNVQQLYVDRLLREGSVTSEEVKGVTDKVEKLLHESFENAKAYKPKTSDWLSSYWKGFRSPHQLSRIRNTGVPAKMLRDVGQIITTLPPGVTPHRQIGKVYEARRAALESGEGVDWAFAEALAFGTLLREGNHVRLSGQDVERGTFSHRHAVVHDQATGERYTPLAAVAEGGHKSQFTVSNSSLNEFGVLGFELGYSLENPNSLVLWEAQFGDFANGAQIIFDQFLSSGEAKWLRQSGLTVLLPHGYDGQGPEHSSARIERYLQMVDDHPYSFPSIDEAQWATGSHMGTRTQNTNMQVCNVSTPAQYFHVLRRQLHRDFRKPLIIFSPKNLLRHPLARSPLSEFDDVPEDSGITGARFKRLIMDERAADRSPHPTPAPGVKKLVFCSGKIYYELATERARQGKQDEVAVVRVEQIAPFPHDLALRELRRYTALRDNPRASVVYCQEEPMNMGAYSYIAPRLQTCMEAAGYDVPSKIAYAGRAPSASTATGFGEVHAQEQAALIKAALDI